MTAREVVLQIVEYVAQNSWRESAFLEPRPSWILNAENLLVFLGTMGAVPEDEVADAFDAAREKIEASK